MSRFQNAISQHAAAMDGTAPAARWGVVQSVDAASMTAKVLIQPEGVLSGFLPIISPMAGNGWGLLHAPVAGQQVMLIPDAGDSESYVILGGTWSTAGMPPAGHASGEVWLVHATGSSVKLLNTGHVVITDAAGASLEMTNNGSIVVVGTLSVIGAIRVNGTLVTVP